LATKAVRDVLLKQSDGPDWFARRLADVQIVEFGRAFDRRLNMNRALRRVPRQY
jgi:hypothetical protein